MKKSDRIGVASLPGDTQFPPEYTGFFTCFNAGDYYEAHNVLEHLWLQQRSNTFYKALIQLAGAFVHLKKHHEFPGHRVHSRRIAPAIKLLRLARSHFAQCPDRCEGLDIPELMAWTGETLILMESTQKNPWSPEGLPQIQNPPLGNE